MNSILDKFLNVGVKKKDGIFFPNKPLLLLAALGRCKKGESRLATFYVYEEAVLSLISDFGKLNVVYPFGRLPADGVWEIHNGVTLTRNRSGDLVRSDLVDGNVLAGFPEGIYNKLIMDSSLLDKVIHAVLELYVPREKHRAVAKAFFLSDSCLNTKYYKSCITYGSDISGTECCEAKVEDSGVLEKNNGYVSYLNTLHNLGANSANALAESQAMNPYFGEIYEPFPLINQVVDTLRDGVEKVVVLTGHAGDGKSTVALDVLKKLRGLPAKDALARPLIEREEIDLPTGKVIIVKDMSELSAERRQQWLHQGFKEPGSWLIVSNTGPLLHSLAEYGEAEGEALGIESQILDRLNRSLVNGLLDEHGLECFGKKLLILNITRLDNVALGARILTRLVEHSGWGQCLGCGAEDACPLMLNRKALKDARGVAEERVRWIYQRLSSYEQRLTLRQIVAQLALGLTGGVSCAEAQQQLNASVVQGNARGVEGLETILFSEGFFGYRNGKPWLPAEGSHAVALVRRATFGGPVGVDFERKLAIEPGIGWASLPSSLAPIGKHWRQRAAEAEGVHWRFALRRMAYLFGRVAPEKKPLAGVYLDSFLQSPSLREFDQWQEKGALTLSPTETKHLLTSCLRVLLEVFSGFSASQFDSHQDMLYLTLRRPDHAVVQPTQLVIESLSFRAFDLGFDPEHRVPILRFERGRVVLPLPLPLLDYIRRRDAGDLGNILSPIHQAQLDWFRAELVAATAGMRRSDEEIELLRASIDGEVHIHRFLLDRDQGLLEQA